MITDNIKNILLILDQKKNIVNKKGIFVIIEEELKLSEPTKEDILDIQKIFHETIFNNFYLKNYPNFFNKDKDAFLDIFNQLSFEKKIETQDKLLEYKDQISYLDFNNIMKNLKSHNLKTEELFDKMKVFTSTLYENFFKEEYIFLSEFKKQESEIMYRTSEVNNFLLPLLLKNKDILYIENNIRTQKEDISTSYLESYIKRMAEVHITSNYKSKNEEESINQIKNFFIETNQEDEFDKYLFFLLLEDNNDLYKTQASIKKINNLFTENHKKIKIYDIPYLNIDFMFNSKFKKNLGKKDFVNFLADNTAETIYPFIITTQYNTNIQDVLYFFPLKQNLLEILINFHEKNPKISSKIFYNHNINRFTGGGISKLLFNTGEKNKITSSNIYNNKELINEVLYSFTNNKDFNKNLLKIRRISKSLAQEISLYCLTADIKLNKENYTYILCDHYQDHINEDIFRKIKIDMNLLLEDPNLEIDYDIVKSFDWDTKIKSHINFITQIEKKELSKTLNQQQVPNSRKRL